MNNFFAELKRRNVVRVAIAYAVISWVLIQVADILLPKFGATDDFLRDFYIILAIGFPAVLVLSWVFEYTPAGLVWAKHVDKSKSFAHNTGQKLNKVIIGALVLAVGFFVYDMIAGGP